MKKTHTIGLFILLTIYPVYRLVRETCWVRHSNYTINNTIRISTTIDPDLFGFQDQNYAKEITIANNASGAKIHVAVASIEPATYFYVDTVNKTKTITIADRYLGKNSYDYGSLELIGRANCLGSENHCAGLNDSSFAALGQPTLFFDDKGAHQGFTINQQPHKK